MIEFKSPCGHTVRARDEDAGREVKCNYCGKDVRVPSDRADDLDFLMAEVGGGTGTATAVKATGGGPFTRRRRGLDSTPRDIILKLVYAAVAITAVVIVTKKYFLPMLNPPPVVEVEQGHVPPPASESRRGRPAFGLAGLSGEGGLYVTSVPPAAEMYLIEEKSWVAGKRIATHEGSKRLAVDQTFSGAEGAFVVEAVLPWNEKSLKAYSDYNTTFRHALESTEGGEARNELMRDYFLPDGAESVFVEGSDDQYYLVRQYRVTVRKDRWGAVTALFIPSNLKIADLVSRYLAVEVRYGFDEEHVLSELEYYNVPLHDRTYVMEVLARIGMVPYVTVEDAGGQKNRRIRLFKVDAGTGQFRTQLLNRPTTPPTGRRGGS